MNWRRVVNADFLFGAAMLVFSVFWGNIGLGFPAGTQDGVPGCGTFPVLVSALLALLSVYLMTQSFIKPTVFFNFREMPLVNKLTIVFTFVILAAYLFIWYHFNYIVATLFMTFTLGTLYRIRWKTNIVFSVVFTLATYYVFGKFLMIILELH